MGYKETEVGSIPVDWRTRTIAQVAPLQRGFDLPSNRLQDGIVPVVYSNGIKNHHSKSMVKGPGVVTGRSGTLGAIHYIEQDYWPHNTALWVTKFNRNYPLFVYYLFKSIGFNRFASGSGVPTLNRNDAHSFSVGLPSNPAEQEAIAEALSDADAYIESLEQLIAKKRLIKQGVMQELLSGKSRVPEFSMSEKWISQELQSFSAFITKGSTPTTYGFSWQNSGILFLRSECVSPKGLDLSQSMYISEEAHASLHRSWIRNGDILMTITGNVGRVVLLQDLDEANMNQHIARIRINSEEVNSDFIYYMLSQASYRAMYNSITTGQAYPQISLKQVRETVVTIPSSRSEQDAIATVLLDLDSEIQLLEKKLSKVRLVKTGMMQELLTGRIRLV